jgi:Rieske Fe-S protein
MNTAFTSRRAVLVAAGTTSAALALAACGGTSGSGEPGGGKSSGAGEEPSRAGGEPGGGVLVRTSEVPEGGGKILEEEKVVVAQPSPGEFKAYSAVCRHQGCLVTSVSDGTINCACHGSRYALEDGSVTRGPATQPLPAVDVSVQGGAVRRG